MLGLAQKVAEPAKQASSIKPGASAPGQAALGSLARETGDSFRCCGFHPLSRAQTCIASVPGAYAPGSMLDACFAGSATFCAKPSILICVYLRKSVAEKLLAIQQHHSFATAKDTGDASGH